jgi:hypothetical protein
MGMFNMVTIKLELFQLALKDKLSKLDTDFQESVTNQNGENRAVKNNLIMNNDHIQKHEAWLDRQQNSIYNIQTTDIKPMKAQLKLKETIANHQSLLARFTEFSSIENMTNYKEVYVPFIENFIS